MFIRLIMRNLQMLYRTLKSVALRPFVVIKYKISSMMNISKFLNQIPKFFASLLAKVKMKPEKREDYVDAGPVFIAKSLLVILALAAVALPLLIYFIGWPWFVSMFLTAKFYVGQPQIEKYNGKVEIFYERKLESPMFKGRLKNGKYTDNGEEFFKNGIKKYTGSYSDGKYDGKGTLFTEDGKQIYNGIFAAGVYDGTGELLLADGSAYKGDFVKGKRTGKGQILKDNKLFYEGDMKDDKRSGSGKQYYSDGSVNYEGAFAEDAFEGDGVEYFQGGRVTKYKGAFKGGLYSGKGVLYDEQGNTIYEGSFERGLFNGDGRYYNKGGELVYSGSFVNGLYDGNGKLTFIKDTMWYEGAFSAGKANGEGKLYKDGMLFYEGFFVDDMMSGTGKLTHNLSGVTYSGLFENNDVAYGKLFNLPVGDIYTAFSKGLTEDTSREDFFFLYNQVFGLAMKLSYANDTDKAKLIAAYTLPKKDGIVNIQNQEDIKLPGHYEPGQTGTGTPDENASSLLGVKQGSMKYYTALYEGYAMRLWTYADTGEVTLIEYYPSSTKLSEGLKQGDKVSAADGKASEKYAVYFKDLGLDMADFTSLGYNQ